VTEPSFDVVFQPDNRRFRSAGPVPFYLAAAGAGILVEQPCGSQGVCGECRVRLVEGEAPPSSADLDHFSSDELRAGWRLACQLVLRGPATLEVPVLSRSVAGKSFGDDLPPDALQHPVVDLVCFPAARPTEVPLSALDRLALAAGRPERSLRASPFALAELASAAAAAGDSRIAAALEDDDLLSIRAGRDEPPLGLAIDIGTTSLAAALVTLDTGRVTTSGAHLNPQVAFGADVIARIQHVLEQADGVGHLAAAARRGLRALVAQLLDTAGAKTEDVVTAAVAGNPTMLHAWMGVSVGSLGVAPYRGVFAGALSCRAAEVELPIHPNASVWLFPQIASHVGGDAVAAAIACEMDRLPGRRLLVDLGTNTEVIVSSGGRSVATSAAAGPAFEGVSIRNGMRAAPGAIDVVTFGDDGRVSANVIGGGRAAGICGSGLIDLVAELLRTGLVSSSGYLRKPAEVAGDVAPRLRDRLVEIGGLQAFTVAADDAEGPRVVLTARDIREVQLAKGSILTAAVLACRHLGFDVRALDEILVAGAFGNYVRKASARRIGLVPAIDPERVHLVGNAAGLGARLALVDRGVRQRACRFAEGVESLELATHPDYQATFMDLLSFP
jgi:uncharacterized 2Fe-2S/4Fe-4S cluster protein (DUF4445 family)